jgi:hypothetical protein
VKWESQGACPIPPAWGVREVPKVRPVPGPVPSHYLTADNIFYCTHDGRRYAFPGDVQGRCVKPPVSWGTECPIPIPGPTTGSLLISFMGRSSQPSVMHTIVYLPDHTTVVASVVTDLESPLQDQLTVLFENLTPGDYYVLVDLDLNYYKWPESVDTQVVIGYRTQLSIHIEEYD